MVKKMLGRLNLKYVNFERGAFKLKVFRRMQGRSFPLRTGEGAD
jgi:hypothetical protein